MSNHATTKVPASKLFEACVMWQERREAIIAERREKSVQDLIEYYAKRRILWVSRPIAITHDEAVEELKRPRNDGWTLSVWDTHGNFFSEQKAIVEQVMGCAMVAMDYSGEVEISSWVADALKPFL